MAVTAKQADCVVVGGGAMGSAVAWQLARRGLDVVLLEQFASGHVRRSSHGSSRIVRLAYFDPFYVELAAATYDQWRELEDESSRQLLTWTGVVDHGDPATVRALSAALDAGGHQIVLLDPAEAGERWTGLRFDGATLFHQRGGRVHADHTVLALQEAAARHGAEIRHGTRVEAIAQVADGVEVRTAAETVQARQAVVAAGAWTSRLLADQVALPTLTVTREQPVHFAPRDPAIAWPSAIHHQADAATRSGASPRGAFTLGCPDGVKVGFHAVGPVVDPESVASVPDEAQLRQLQDYAAEWIPGVDASVAEPAPCLYTLTDNSDFVIDRVGRVTIAAGFSGHGFKFTPEIGRIVTELVVGVGHPPERFRLAR